MVIDFSDGSTWVIPDGYQLPSWKEKPSFCRSCGAHILWLTSKFGNKNPFEHDGVSHFARCPQADEWRKK